MVDVVFRDVDEATLRKLLDRLGDVPYQLEGGTPRWTADLATQILRLATRRASTEDDMRVGIIGAGRIGGNCARHAGFQPVDLGRVADCAVMEAPRGPGSVYGEEYRLVDAEQVVDAVHAGRPIPPTPDYYGRGSART